MDSSKSPRGKLSHDELITNRNSSSVLAGLRLCMSLKRRP